MNGNKNKLSVYVKK